MGYESGEKCNILCGDFESNFTTESEKWYLCKDGRDREKHEGHFGYKKKNEKIISRSERWGEKG